MTEPEPPENQALDDWPDDDWDGDWDAEEPDAGEQAGQSGGIGAVGGHHNVNVTDARGPVHIGDRVRLYLQSVAAEAGTGRPPRLVPEDILTDLDERFVAPSGYGDLVARLRGPGTVVVSGIPGCGRRSAALMVLKDSGEGTPRFRELPDDGGDGEFVVDPDGIEAGERLLLDLSSVTGPISQRVLANLRAYRAAVVEQRAYLAVVLSPELGYVAAELGIEAIPIGRPDGRAVFRRHLECLGIEVGERELADGALAPHLDHDPMRHLAALAERVRRARSAATGQGDWPAWLAAALRPDAERADVARFVRDNPDGRVRALLLAAAVFEHAAPEVVAAAATEFLDVVKYPPHEGHRLDLPDLAEALGMFEATIVGLRVRFRSVAYADAVRTHYWDTFPDLRQNLRRWLDRGVRLRALPPADRAAAVLRYTDQCLRVGHPEDLCVLVEQWARNAPSTLDQLLDAAGPALTRGLLSERYGAWFRRRVYFWSTNRQLWPSLATLLVGLCEGVIAPVRPQQALVRLRHLTRHTNAVVVEARAALAKLCQDGRFARRMLTRVHEDLVGGRQQDVDYDLFTDVADPVRLTAGAGTFPRVGERPVRNMLVDGWAAWLATRPYADTSVAVSRWLDAHAAASGRDALLEVLAAATGGHSRARAVLYAVSRDWVAADRSPERTRTAALLREACAEVRQDTPPFESPATQGATY